MKQNNTTYDGLALLWLPDFCQATFDEFHFMIYQAKYSDANELSNMIIREMVKQNTGKKITDQVKELFLESHTISRNNPIFGFMSKYAIY